MDMDRINTIINIITITITSINIIIYILLLKIHILQSLFCQGYFLIVFAQIVLEFLTNLSILFISIIMLLSFENKDFLIIPIIIFNFSYISDIIYNIETLYYISNTHFERKEIKGDDLLEYNLDESNEVNLDKVKEKKIFINYHLISIVLSLVHTSLYCYIIYNNDAIEYIYYLYFIKFDNKEFYYGWFFIFNCLFFLLTIFYCIKDKMKNKNFLIYCLFSSLFSLIYPIKYICSFIKEDMHKYELIFIFVYCSVTLLYLLSNCIYRLNSYYIQIILGNKRKNGCSKFEQGIKIFFTCRKNLIPVIEIDNNCIDSSFGYEKDLSAEKTNFFD